MAKRNSSGANTPKSQMLGTSYPAGSMPAGSADLGRGTMETPGAPGVIGKVLVNSIRGAGQAPTIAAGAAAGASPTVAVAGSDIAGVITITTGTTALGSNGTLATVSFRKARAAAPQAVILTPANAAAAALAEALVPFVDSAAMTAAQFVIKAGATALVDATAYKFHFVAVG